jgi:UDP-glucose 4-epimerase
VNRLAEALTEASGREAEVRYAPPRAGELRHSSLDAGWLRALGWQPRTGLVEGLRNTYEWIHAATEAVALRTAV